MGCSWTIHSLRGEANRAKLLHSRARLICHLVSGNLSQARAILTLLGWKSPRRIRNTVRIQHHDRRSLTRRTKRCAGQLVLPRVCGSARQGTPPGVSTPVKWATPMRVLACALRTTLTSAVTHAHEETQRHVFLAPEWPCVDGIKIGSAPPNSIKRRAAHRQHQRFVCRHGGNGRGPNARPNGNKLPRSVRSAIRRPPKSVRRASVSGRR